MISRLTLLGYHHDYRYNDGVVAFPVYRMFKLNELDRVAITAEEIQYPSSPADNFFSDKFFSSFLSRIEPRTTPDVFTCFGRSSQQPDLRQYVILVPQKTLGVWAPPFSTELAQCGLWRNSSSSINTDWQINIRHQSINFLLHWFPLLPNKFFYPFPA